MAKSIRYLPLPVDIPEGGRVESGVVQFGDDWPGVFLRGDHACSYAFTLLIAVSQIREGIPLTAIQFSMLESIGKILSECETTVGQRITEHVKSDAIKRRFSDRDIDKEC